MQNIGLNQVIKQEDLRRISKFATLDSQSLLSFHCYSSRYLRSLATYISQAVRIKRAFIATGLREKILLRKYILWGVFSGMLHPVTYRQWKLLSKIKNGSRGIYIYMMRISCIYTNFGRLLVTLEAGRIWVLAQKEQKEWS